MLKNYFRVAFRNMRRNKGFSAINIGGLALGLAICLLILQYVSDELSYDRYNVHADRIYRINNEVKFGGNHLDLAVAPAPTGPAVQRELPGVEQYCRLQWHGSFLIRKGDGNLRESRVAWADSTLFAVFSLPLVQGDPQTALVAPHSLVISETMARKYFNRTDIVGQTLSVNDTEIYRLTAVMKDMPAQSHFRFDFFVSMSGNEDSRNSNWLSENYSTYILLRPQTSASALVPELDQLSDRYIGPELQAIIHENLAEFKKSGAFIRNSLTPLTDIYLHSNKIGELDANGSIETVFIFSAVAIFILVIACVNFMNLSTARSANRAKEVGVRKVLGSQRKSLIAQFLAESFLVSSIALILALVAALLLLPYFNQLAGKQLSWRVLFRPAMLGFLCLLIPGVSLLAGSYPAFYLSAFQPIDVLKGRLAKGFRASRLRNVLVVFQFAISVVLIIGTLVIYNQLHYIRTRDLGFNREQVLVIKGAEALNGRNHAFQNELTQMSGVQTLTMTGFLPVDGLRSNDAFFTSPAMDQQTAISMQKWSVDEQYLSTLGLELTQGRNFSKDFPSDSSGLIINEAAAKFLGGGQLLGKQLYELNGIGPNAGVTISHIVGIVRNFNFNSLREVISPLALRLSENSSRIAVRFQKADLNGLLSRIESAWHSLAPGQPFEYQFLDDQFNNAYQAERKTGQLFISFAVLALFIACLGLFGLAAYAAEQRTREIGIRKVLGASVRNLAGLLSKDFFRLVMLSVLFAFPLAWWLMNKWLQNFAYRLPIGWWVFAAAGLGALLVALLTVSALAIRAALANPTQSLRTE